MPASRSALAWAALACCAAALLAGGALQSARGAALGAAWAPRSLMSMSTDAGKAALAAADAQIDVADAVGDATNDAREASGDGEFSDDLRGESGAAGMAQVTPERIMLDEEAVKSAARGQSKHGAAPRGRKHGAARRAARDAAAVGASVFDTEVQAARDLARESDAASGLTRALAAVRRQRLSRMARAGRTQALLGAGGAGRGKDLKPRDGKKSADFFGDEAGVAANIHGEDGSAACDYDDQVSCCWHTSCGVYCMWPRRPPCSSGEGLCVCVVVCVCVCVCVCVFMCVFVCVHTIMCAYV